MTHFCCGRFCPGLSWSPSNVRHPWTCVVPDRPTARLHPRKHKVRARWRIRKVFNRPQGRTSPKTIRKWGIYNMPLVGLLAEWRKVLGWNQKP